MTSSMGLLLLLLLVVVGDVVMVGGVLEEADTDADEDEEGPTRSLFPIDVARKRLEEGEEDAEEGEEEASDFVDFFFVVVVGVLPAAGEEEGDVLGFFLPLSDPRAAAQRTEGDRDREREREWERA